MLVRRIWYLLNRRRLERELDEEMAAHRGRMCPEDQARFGSALRLREESRDAWGWTWLDALSQDTRFACRILRRAPGFTAAIVAVLGLGMGVALTAFQVFNILVLRPLPVRSPENIFVLQRRGPDSLSSALSYPEFEFIRGHNRPLAAVFAQTSNQVQIGRDAELRADARFVSSNYLVELGARTACGRLLTPDIDGQPGAAPAVVLGHGFWQRHFGSNPGVVGRTIYVGGRPASIVGVAVSGFHGIGWSAVDLWIPLEQHSWFFPGSDLFRNVSKHPLRVFARLRDSFTTATAEESLRPLVAEFRRIYPGSVGASQWLECVPAGHAVRIGLRDYQVVMFFGALVVLVLAVSLSNAGTLQLSCALARSREISIRCSLGAGRSRVLRQLVTEALLVTFVATAAGLLLSYWGTRAILLSLETPLAAMSGFDHRSVAAVIVLSLCSAVLFGTAPAFQISSGRSGSNRLRGFLIVTQVTASCVLLIVAGLHVRGLQHVLSAPLGFQYQDVVAIDPAFGTQGYSPERTRLALSLLLPRVQAVPGVRSASLCVMPPLGYDFWIEGIRATSGQYVMAHANAVDPNYFQTLRIAMVSGRVFRPGERDAAIVSQSLALKAWAGENPLGRQLEDGKVVVGVAANARTMALRDGEAVEIYFPFDAADRQVTKALLLVRTAGAPRIHLPAIRSAVSSADHQLFQYDLLTDKFERITEGTRKGAAAVGIIGLLTLGIAATGIGGLLSHAVSQRTREIAIRATLGARSGDIVKRLLAQAMIPVSVGLVVGAAAGYAASSFMKHQIYGIGRLDPAAYVAALCLLLAAAAVAAISPVRRALQVNPVDALRHE